jgi:hypothetical protein
VRIYRKLVLAGHSPEGALRIIVDARRKDAYALSWVMEICLGK